MLHKKDQRLMQDMGRNNMKNLKGILSLLLVLSVGTSAIGCQAKPEESTEETTA